MQTSINYFPALNTQLINWVKGYWGTGDSDGYFKIYPTSNTNEKPVCIPGNYIGDTTNITPWYVPTMGTIFLLSSGSGMDCWYTLLDSEGKIVSNYSINLDGLTQEDNEVLSMRPIELVLFLLVKDGVNELNLGGYPLNFNSLLPWNLS